MTLLAYSPDSYPFRTTSIFGEASSGAFKAHQSHAVFQPIYHIRENAKPLLAGFEALARRTHKNKEEGPASFLPELEKSYGLKHLDLLMLRRACILAKGLAAIGNTYNGKPLTVNVNLSAQTLADLDCLDQINAICQQENIDPAQINFEVLEQPFDSPHAALFIARLNNAGHTIYMDDFGQDASNKMRFESLRPIIGVVKLSRELLLEHQKSGANNGLPPLENFGDRPVVYEGPDAELIQQIKAHHGDKGALVQSYETGRPMDLALALQLACMSNPSYQPEHYVHAHNVYEWPTGS